MERRGEVVTPDFSNWKRTPVENPARNGKFSQETEAPRLHVVPRVDDDGPLLRRPNKEKVGSDAFDLEYDSPPTPAEIRRDIVSYLNEYRLQVQKHPYQLIFGRQADGRGPISLRDQDRGESLGRKSKRSVVSRTLKKQPTHREEAESQGLEILDSQLRFSQNGDTLVWGSPPGPKDQGYGDYGFLYVGKVSKTSGNEASIAMQAIRIEKPSLDQYNAAFSELTGDNIEYQHADLFLARPRIVHKDMSHHDIDIILQKNFSFVPDEKDRAIARRVIKRMQPMIEDFVEVMQHGGKEEPIKAFYALENYALILKKEESNDNENVIFLDERAKPVRLNDIVNTLGILPPPEVKGSCGSSGGNSFSNSLSSISGSESIANGVFGDDEFGSLDFECSNGHKNTRPRGELIPNCTTCGESVAC